MNDKLIGQQCTAIVLALCGNNRQTASLWWSSPNKAFNMLRPMEVPIEIVYTYLVKNAQHGLI